MLHASYFTLSYFVVVVETASCGRAAGGGGGGVSRFPWRTSRNFGARDLGRPRSLPACLPAFLPSFLPYVWSLSSLPPSLPSLTLLIFYASHAAHVKPSRLRVRPPVRRSSCRSCSSCSFSRRVRGARPTDRPTDAQICRGNNPFQTFRTVRARRPRDAVRSSAPCPCKVKAGPAIHRASTRPSFLPSFFPRCSVFSPPPDRRWGANFAF